MKELDSLRAHGSDGMSSFVLKKQGSRETLVKPLVMFKISLNERNVPTCIKESQRSNCGKYSDKKEALNEIPISLISMTFKILRNITSQTSS